MDTATELKTVESILQPWTMSLTHPEENRVDMAIKAEDLVPAVQALLNAHWGYLAAITGLDHPAKAPKTPDEPVAENQMEALYHFCENASIATLRISVPYSHPVVHTLCDIIPSATLYEREMIEMFGFEITGTPSTDRLILPDDWPQGIYPLRKSFTGFSAQPKGTQEA